VFELKSQTHRFHTLFTNPYMHKDSGQKKHKQAITRMPVPTTFHIDNGQNNQLEIESLMHPADASNFT
jgi:hypothetical protein